MLRVPLQHAGGLATRILVGAAQPVSRGQVIAEAASDDSLDVRSPVDGQVVELDRAWTARGGFVPAAKIEPADRDTPKRRLFEVSESTTLGVCGLAQMAGIVGADGVPLHVLIGRAPPNGFDTLIVNGMETEPNLTADLRLLAERSESIIETMDWLAGIESGRLFRSVLLAVALRHSRIVRQLTRCAAALSRRVRVVALEDKFPQCHPALLCKVILGREPADRQHGLDAGALVLPLATVAALQEARDSGEPSIARVVTISGDAAERPCNLVVPFGTPIERLIEHVGLRRRPIAVLAGGPMTGIPLPDTQAVTSADVAGVTLLSRLPRGEPVACVRCGWCVEDCPAGIDPRYLSQLEMRGRFSKSDQIALSACIECGICSYVCPSQLPLTETIRQCRRRLDGSAVPT